MPPDLTDRERDLLEMVANWVDKEGYQPSFREIAGHFDWGSITTVSVLCRRLEDKGVIALQGKRAMSFEWKKFVTRRQKHDAQGTDGSGHGHAAGRHVRRDGGRRGRRSHRVACAPRGGLE